MTKLQLVVLVVALADCPTEGDQHQPHLVEQGTPRLPATASRLRCDQPDTKVKANEVLVYLINGEGTLPSDRSMVAVSRQVPPQLRETTLKAALEALLQGPSLNEQRRECRSMFSQATSRALKSASIGDGLATIDFRPLILDIPNVSTSTAGSFFRHQLDLTVFQFPTVNAIRYEVGGSCDAFHRGLESVCNIRHRNGCLTFPNSTEPRACPRG